MRAGPGAWGRAPPPPPPLPPPPAGPFASPQPPRLPPCRSKERKELERARKARRHKNFNLIQEVVLLWEEARRHDTTPEKRSKLVTAILAKVQGRVAELAGSHSASRVIQTCAKHGTPAGKAAARAGAAGDCLGAAQGRRRACSRPCKAPAVVGAPSDAWLDWVHTALFSCLLVAERAAIQKELEPKLLELSKSP